jgi:hypothetical protein
VTDTPVNLNLECLELSNTIKCSSHEALTLWNWLCVKWAQEHNKPGMFVCRVLKQSRLTGIKIANRLKKDSNSLGNWY